jgi:hypothetical protein
MKKHTATKCNATAMRAVEGAFAGLIRLALADEDTAEPFRVGLEILCEQPDQLAAPAHGRIAHRQQRLVSQIDATVAGGVAGWGERFRLVHDLSGPFVHQLALPPTL